MSIRVNNLTKIYGDQKAIDKISFKIDSGEIVGFLGPNGAGKSTTMKILTGYLPQSFGTAEVLGMNVQSDAVKIKQRIGYLPELNPLYDDMYVREYLDFSADIYKIKDKKSAVGKAIEMTGLSLEKRKKIQELSKGYKQRVGLAQALLNDPDVLILDEPTSGLDPNQMSEIRSLILSLGKDKTILLSSHIMQEVEAMCSRVIIINNGMIVADDKVDAVKNRISGGNRTTIVKFRASIDIDEFKKRNGISSVRFISDTSYEVKSQTETDVADILFKFAIDSNTIIIEQKEQVESLESVFQKLTSNA